MFWRIKKHKSNNQLSVAPKRSTDKYVKKKRKFNCWTNKISINNLVSFFFFQLRICRPFHRIKGTWLWIGKIISIKRKLSIPKWKTLGNFYLLYFFFSFSFLFPSIESWYHHEQFLFFTLVLFEGDERRKFYGFFFEIE